MFRKPPLDESKLGDAFDVVKSAADGQNIKRNLTVNALKTLKESASVITEPPLAVKLYHALNTGFIIEASTELKHDDVKDVTSLRLKLLKQKELKAEENFETALLALLSNPAFQVHDIIRFYRKSELNLSVESAPVEEDEPQTVNDIFLPTLNKYRHRTFTYIPDYERPNAFPEDRIMVDLAPEALVYKARLLGVTGPELVAFPELVTTLITLPAR